jgi:hypothetical protein
VNTANINSDREPTVSAEAAWLTALGLKDRQVTVWLRTGRKVTGLANGQYPSHKRRRNGAVTRIRLKDAKVTEDGDSGSGSEYASATELEHEPTGMFVWVSVEDIELIGAESQEAVSGASGAKPNQPASPTAPST